nr:hypothetical protein CFP56_30672 [Quercus suber]
MGAHPDPTTHPGQVVNLLFLLAARDDASSSTKACPGKNLLIHRSAYITDHALAFTPGRVFLPYSSRLNLAFVYSTICRMSVTSFHLHSPTYGDAQRPVLSAKVAATDIHRSFGTYRDSFAHDRFPGLRSPNYESLVRSKTQDNWLAGASTPPRLCFSLGDQIGDSETNLSGHMSDRSQLQRVSRSTQEHNDQPISAPNRPNGNDQHVQRPTSSATLLPIQQRLRIAPGRSLELPPIPQLPAAPSGNLSSSGPRLASVSSLLNSTEDDEQHGRRRDVPALESPATSRSFSQLQSAYGKKSPQLMPDSLADRQPRRILTPMSPSMHRVASLSALGQSAQGSIDAHQSPFIVSPPMNTAAIDSTASGVPALPDPRADKRPNLGQSGVATTSEGTHQNGSVTAYDSEQASTSTTPDPPYFDHSQAERQSPQTQNLSDRSHSIANTSSVGTSPTGQDRARPAGIPIASSSSHNVYQMMTLETTAGTVQLPVDVQAASRVADEKRRRNAGASARFRQRRKEKEREASTTISRLEQRVKDAVEDVDFYRRERDHLANALLQAPGGDRHFPRPQSPRRRRPSSNYVDPAGSIGSAYDMDDEPPSPNDGRNVRRRTSIMSAPPPPHAGPQSAPSGSGSYSNVHPSPYNGVPVLQQHPHPQVPGPGRFSSPPSRASILDARPRQSSVPSAQQHHVYSHQQQTSGPHGLTRAPQLLHGPSQTGPWNPYAADKGARDTPDNHVSIVSTVRPLQIECSDLAIHSFFQLFPIEELFNLPPIDTIVLPSQVTPQSFQVVQTFAASAGPVFVTTFACATGSAGWDPIAASHYSLALLPDLSGVMLRQLSLTEWDTAEDAFWCLVESQPPGNDSSQERYERKLIREYALAFFQLPRRSQVQASRLHISTNNLSSPSLLSCRSQHELMRRCGSHGLTHSFFSVTRDVEPNRCNLLHTIRDTCTGIEVLHGNRDRKDRAPGVGQRQLLRQAKSQRILHVGQHCYKRGAYQAMSIAPDILTSFRFWCTVRAVRLSTGTLLDLLLSRSSEVTSVARPLDEMMLATREHSPVSPRSPPTFSRFCHARAYHGPWLHPTLPRSLVRRHAISATGTHLPAP